MKNLGTCPFRICVCIPLVKIIFNRDVSIDLIWLDNMPVLHILCTNTNVGNATWLESTSARDRCLDFLDCYSIAKLEFPTRSGVRGSQKLHKTYFETVRR